MSLPDICSYLGPMGFAVTIISFEERTFFHFKLIYLIAYNFMDLLNKLLIELLLLL